MPDPNRPRPEETGTADIRSVNIDENDFSPDQVSDPAPQRDEKATGEQRNFGQEKQDEEIKSLKQDREQRLLFGYLVFTLVVGWLLFVGTTLILTAIHWPCNFSLSDTVLVALLGTTTVSVIGLLATVAFYLFPKR